MKFNEQIELQLMSPDHCNDLFRLVEANRQYLQQWLPWVETTKSSADTLSFLHSVVDQFEAGKGPQYVILFENTMCGTCGYHPLDTHNRVGEIGYWLGESYMGKGIISKAIKALVEIGFSEHNLQRIEIACARENFRSRAVAQRLGFTFEGVLPGHKILHGEPVDHAIYSMQAS